MNNKKFANCWSSIVGRVLNDFLWPNKPWTWYPGLFFKVYNSFVFQMSLSECVSTLGPAAVPVRWRTATWQLFAVKHSRRCDLTVSNSSTWLLDTSRRTKVREGYWIEFIQLKSFLNYTDFSFLTQFQLHFIEIAPNHKNCCLANSEDKTSVGERCSWRICTVMKKSVFTGFWQTVKNKAHSYCFHRN